MPAPLPVRPELVEGRERSGPLLSQGWSWGVRRGSHGAWEAPPPFPRTSHRLSCESRNPSLSAGTTTQPSFLPPTRNPSLGALGGPAPFPPTPQPSFLRAGIHPFPRARRRPNRHSCPRAGIHPSHAHPQIPVNNPQLTPIHFLTCVVEFPIGYGFSIAHSQNGPLEHVAMAR